MTDVDKIEIKGRSFLSGDLTHQKELIRFPGKIESGFKAAFSPGNGNNTDSSKIN